MKKRIELPESACFPGGAYYCVLCDSEWRQIRQPGEPRCTQGCPGSWVYSGGKIDNNLLRRWLAAGYEVSCRLSLTNEVIVAGDPTETHAFTTWADGEGRANYEAHQTGHLFERARDLALHLFPDGVPFGHRAEDGLPLQSALELLVLGAPPDAPQEEKIWHAQMVHRRLELEHLLIEMNEEVV